LQGGIHFSTIHRACYCSCSFLIQLIVLGEQVKFRCERDLLLEALGNVSRAAAGRGMSVVHSGMKLEVQGDAVVVTGSDSDLTVEVEVPLVNAAPGSVVVPARLVTDWVRALEPGAVSVEAEDSEARLWSGRSQCTVRVLPLEEMVSLPRVQGEGVTVAASELAEALRQVVPAAGREDTRPILTGVLIAAEGAGVRLVATDSYRLAMRDLAGTTMLAEGQRVLVPSRALGELTRLLTGAGEVTVCLGDFEVTFLVGNTRLTSRLIEGEFPNYRQLIPSSYSNRLTVSKDAFLDAVRRVRLLARESTPVRLALRGEGMELTATTQDVGQAREELDAKYEGAEMVVAFNPDYLIAGVDAVGGDEVVIETVDALKPATVKATEASDYLYLLMPVRVS
jgi:DNA polymerase-3 subunit beta